MLNFVLWDLLNCWWTFSQEGRILYFEFSICLRWWILCCDVLIFYFKICLILYFEVCWILYFEMFMNDIDWIFPQEEDEQLLSKQQKYTSCLSYLSSYSVFFFFWKSHFFQYFTTFETPFQPVCCCLSAFSS